MEFSEREAAGLLTPRAKRHPQREAWPRGLRRQSVADYVGVSPTQLDKWVMEGVLPSPRKIGGVVIWDRYALDEAMEAIFYPEADAENDAEMTAWNDVCA